MPSSTASSSKPSASNNKNSTKSCGVERTVSFSAQQQGHNKKNRPPTTKKQSENTNTAALEALQQAAAPPSFRDHYTSAMSPSDNQAELSPLSPTADEDQQHQQKQQQQHHEDNNDELDELDHHKAVDDDDRSRDSNDQKHQRFEDRMTIESTGDGGDSSLDSSLDQSHISGGSSSTGSSASAALRAKSTLPCGMKMPVLMTMVVLVPIIFLVVYTTIPLTQAIKAMEIISEHEDVFRSVRRAGTAATDEYLAASELIYLYSNKDFNNQTLYEINGAKLKAARSRFDAHLNTIRTVMDQSSLDRRPRFKRDLDRVIAGFIRERERVDSKIANGPEYRREMVELILRLTRLLLYFGTDDRGELLRVRIQNYCVLRRLDVLANNMIVSAKGLIREATSHNIYDADFATMLQSRYDSVQIDLAFLLDAMDEEVSVVVEQFAESDSWADWARTVRLLLSGNITKFSHLTVAELNNRNTEVNEFIERLDVIVINSISDGRLATDVITLESIKMVLAIVACIVALIFVIYYNNTEQARLERALDATATLASAVQRFVPRNQLKTMGVRSITQVQPGMSTEVAQTITFSDIRDFTRLSESMSRLELFDWLQNYVERMTRVVSEEKSYIMAFLGDGLGICSPQPTYAVNAAIKMHVAVEGLNLDIIAKNGELPVKIGVGIHHGVVVAGVFGDVNRLSCSLIAPDVNFASRLEALTKSFGVKTLISESVVDQISSDVFLFRNVGKVQVKGSTKAVPVFDLYQTDNLDVKKFKTETKKEFETAIQLLDTDRVQANERFETLLLRSRMLNVSDLALQMHFERSSAINDQDDPHSLDATTSVLSFEKDGALRSTSQVQTHLNNNNFTSNNNTNNNSLTSGHLPLYQPQQQHRSASASASAQSSPIVHRSLTPRASIDNLIAKHHRKNNNNNSNNRQQQEHRDELQHSSKNIQLSSENSIDMTTVVGGSDRTQLHRRHRHTGSSNNILTAAASTNSGAIGNNNNNNTHGHRNHSHKNNKNKNLIMMSMMHNQGDEQKSQPQHHRQPQHQEAQKMHSTRQYRDSPEEEESTHQPRSNGIVVVHRQRPPADDDDADEEELAVLDATSEPTSNPSAWPTKLRNKRSRSNKKADNLTSIDTQQPESSGLSVKEACDNHNNNIQQQQQDGSGRGGDDDLISLVQQEGNITQTSSKHSLDSSSRRMVIMRPPNNLSRTQYHASGNAVAVVPDEQVHSFNDSKKPQQQEQPREGNYHHPHAVHQGAHRRQNNNIIVNHDNKNNDDEGDATPTTFAMKLNQVQAMKQNGNKEMDNASPDHVLREAKRRN